MNNSSHLPKSLSSWDHTINIVYRMHGTGVSSNLLQRGYKKSITKNWMKIWKSFRETFKSYALKKWNCATNQSSCHQNSLNENTHIKKPWQSERPCCWVREHWNTMTIIMMDKQCMIQVEMAILVSHQVCLIMPSAFCVVSTCSHSHSTHLKMVFFMREQGLCTRRETPKSQHKMVQNAKKN